MQVVELEGEGVLALAQEGPWRWDRVISSVLFMAGSRGVNTMLQLAGANTVSFLLRLEWNNRVQSLGLIEVVS